MIAAYKASSLLPSHCRGCSTLSKLATVEPENHQQPRFSAHGRVFNHHRYPLAKLNQEKRSMDVIRRVTLAMGNQTLEIQSAILDKKVSQDDRYRL